MKSIGFSDPVDPSSDTKGKTSPQRVLKLAGVPSSAHFLSDSIVSGLKSKKFEIEQEVIALDGAPSVATAIREMRIHHNLVDVRAAVETALTFVRNLIKNPKDPKLYRVKRGNAAFHRSIGRLNGGLLLMRTIGFVGVEPAISNTKANFRDETGPVLVLKPLGSETKAHYDAVKDHHTDTGIQKFNQKNKENTPTYHTNNSYLLHLALCFYLYF